MVENSPVIFYIPEEKEKEQCIKFFGGLSCESISAPPLHWK